MTVSTAKFTVGQLVFHKRFDYLGVIYDIDPVFMASDEWYEEVATSRPPKEQPWYHVLVHQQAHTTYVAERHLVAAESFFIIDHPLIEEYFLGHDDCRYLPRGTQ